MFLRTVLVILLFAVFTACGDAKKSTHSDNDTNADDDTAVTDDDSIPATCGNGQLDTGEVCDGDILNCTDIDNLLYLSGKAKCKEDCSGYDTITCEEVAHECGNEVVEGPETCDGGVKNCVEIDSTLFKGGKAACIEDCSGWDTLTCEEIETVCGNSIIEGAEVCDSDSKKCYDIDPEYYLGTADCNTTCDGWNLADCKKGKAVCGNDIVEGSELCDGSLDLCADIDSDSFSGGKAYCLDDCSGWDTITCEEKAPGIDWTKGESNQAQFNPRASHCAAFFKNKFYVIGGTAFDGVEEKTVADVWTSTDGKTWSLVTETAAIGARNRHRCVVHDNKLWVIGGRDGNGTELTDVWFTSNGTDWETDVVPEGGLLAGSNAAVISNGTKLFVFGTAPYFGTPSAYSRDSTGWTVLPTPSYGGDGSFGYAFLNGTMYLAGGIDSAQTATTNSIYYTADGEKWDVATGAFTARAFAPMININNTLYLIGGNNLTTRLNDVWTSTDGLNFVQVTGETGFTARSSHAAAASDSKLCIIGGTMVDNSYSSDVWCVQL
ncbi:MAG TPA: hypothetical protein PLZ43_12090 [bacterium]|nr:hypothetical protein [bacterium]